MSEELLDKQLSDKPAKKSSRSTFVRLLMSSGIIVGGVFLFIATQIIAAVIVGVTLSSLFGFETARIEELFASNSLILAMYMLSSVLLLGFLYVISRVRKRRFLHDIGLHRRPGWSDVAWSFLAYAAYFIFFALIVTVLVPLFDQVIDVNQQQDLGVNLDFNASNAVVLFIMFVIIPPIVEEILFRGWMYRSTRRLLPRWFAAIIVSFVFGVMHLELLSGNSPNWIAMIDTTILSVVLIILVEKTGSLWSAIYVHALKNLVAYTLLLSGIV